MAKRRKVWMYCPPKPPKPKVPDAVGAEVSAKAQQLIDEELMPKHIKPPPENPQFNYPIDIFTKWFQSYFYFCTTYANVHPEANSRMFEVRFARMGYAGDGKFNLAYRRYTGQWWQLYSCRTVDECLALIRDEPHFLP